MLRIYTSTTSLKPLETQTVQNAGPVEPLP
jgi:hypothetical protein